MVGYGYGRRSRAIRSGLVVEQEKGIRRWAMGRLGAYEHCTQHAIHEPLGRL